MNLQIIDRFGNPFRFSDPSEIKLLFPYNGDRFLSKKLSKGQIEIIDGQSGKIKVQFSDFDIGGLNEGRSQNFGGEIVQGSSKFTVHFERALHVVNIEGKRAIEQ